METLAKNEDFSEIVTRTGNKVTINRKHELSLKKYGVSSGDGIYHLRRPSRGTVLGIGPELGTDAPGRDVLWVALEADNFTPTCVIYPEEIVLLVGSRTK